MTMTSVDPLAAEASAGDPDAKHEAEIVAMPLRPSESASNEAERALTVARGREKEGACDASS